MRYIDIVFDGPPAHESGRFIEVEDDAGNSISVGEWVARNDGYWVLRIPDPRPPEIFPGTHEALDCLTSVQTGQNQ